MSARKRLKLNVGDVFSIPVGDERVGYGQIVARWSGSGGHFYFAVYDVVDPAAEVPDLESIVSSPLVFLALSMDALLVHEHWLLVGHHEIDEAAIPWPAYKEGVSPPGTFDVVDHTGTRRRRASEDEIESLPFRKVVAPIRIEKALRALHGEGLWDDAYDALRPVPEGQTAAALLT